MIPILYHIWVGANTNLMEEWLFNFCDLWT